MEPQRNWGNAFDSSCQSVLLAGLGALRVKPSEKPWVRSVAGVAWEELTEIQQQVTGKSGDEIQGTVTHKSQAAWPGRGRGCARAATSPPVLPGKV